MKRSVSRIFNYAIGGTAVQIAAADPHRVSMIISHVQPFEVSVGFSSGVTFANGLPLSGTLSFHTISLETHGDAVRRAWWCIAAGAGTLGVLETRLEERD